MSAIFDKPFDKTKKIVKTLFNGSPNLITAPDLNRQISQLSAQSTALDQRVGFITDFASTVGYDGVNEQLIVTPTCSYIEMAGIAFTPPANNVAITGDYNEVPLYLCLTATKSVVTFADDAGRKLAGAYFQDGTSKAAADQEIYSNEQYVLSQSPLTVPNFIGVVAKYERSGLNFSQTINGVPRGSSVILSSRLFTHNSSVPPRIYTGQTYDEALSVVANRILYEDPEVSIATANIISDYLTSLPTATLQRSRGRLFLNLPYIHIPVESYSRSSYLFIVTPQASDFVIPYMTIYRAQSAIFSSLTFNVSPQARSCSVYSAGPSHVAAISHPTLELHGAAMATPVYGVFSDVNESFIGVLVTWPSGQAPTNMSGDEPTSYWGNFQLMGGGDLRLYSEPYEFYLI